MKNENYEQRNLNLGIETENCVRQNPRTRRRNRAAMWFSQMRRIVDDAREWPAAPLPKEQSFPQ